MIIAGFFATSFTFCALIVGYATYLSSRALDADATIVGVIMTSCLAIGAVCAVAIMVTL